ncbi:MAG: Hsp20/alpha crystallin family protein [Pseudomonadota bacterium]
MSSMKKYQPWSLFEQLHHELDELYGRRAESRSSPFLSQFSTMSKNTDWMPAVDLEERPNGYVLKVEIPGIDPKEVDISAQGGVLTIKGEKKYDRETDENGLKVMERAYGSFFRQFTLPVNANADDISASADIGVLTIEIPKSQTTEPRKIPVS